jgi:sodium transport system permease protein
MRNVFLVYKKELLSFFRDKYTLIYSILFPIMLYPLMFWGMNQVFSLQAGTLDKMTYRVAFTGSHLPEMIHAIIESDDNFDLQSELVIEDLDRAEQLKQMNLDAVIHPLSCSPILDIQLIYDSSSDRSTAAKERLEHLMFDLKISHLLPAETALEFTMPDLEVVSFDLSSKEEKSRYLLGILLPMIMVIITVMGALYPSIEVIVSERERQTLETTLSTPLSGGTLIIGKFLAVVSMAMIAVTLNVSSILITVKHTLFISAGLKDLNFTIPLTALPLIFFGALLVATMFSALMILIAAYAKTFKEAQSFITPIYAVGIQPAVVSALPAIPFNEMTALIPISNVSLMFRELIRNQFDPIPIAITVGSLILWCVIFLTAAKFLLRRDDIVLGLDRKKFKLRFKKQTTGSQKQ